LKASDAPRRRRLAYTVKRSATKLDLTLLIKALGSETSPYVAGRMTWG
jgi:hypothetical protein